MVNLFPIFEDALLSAKYAPNQYLTKIPIEACQMLFCAKILIDDELKWIEECKTYCGEKWKLMNESGKRKTSINIELSLKNIPYKLMNVNHPMCKWVRETKLNFLWASKYAYYLCIEHEKHYTPHKCKAFAEWFLENPPSFAQDALTTMPLCFGEFKPYIENLNLQYMNAFRVYVITKLLEGKVNYKNRERFEKVLLDNESLLYYAKLVISKKEKLLTTSRKRVRS